MDAASGRDSLAGDNGGVLCVANPVGVGGLEDGHPVMIRDKVEISPNARDVLDLWAGIAATMGSDGKIVHKESMAITSCSFCRVGGRLPGLPFPDIVRNDAESAYCRETLRIII